MDPVRYNRKRGYSRVLWSAIQAAVGATVDGDPGPETARKVRDWQAAHGLTADGKVGPTTLETLDVEVVTDPEVDASTDLLHPLPPPTRRWGYEHFELTGYPYRDIYLEEVTGTGSWAAGAIRMVAGRQLRRPIYSRGFGSIITLDRLSFGIAHWWLDTLRGFLADYCAEHPQIAAWAFGEAHARGLTDKGYVKRYVKRGHMGLHPDLEWLVAGLWAVALHPSMVRHQAVTWLTDYVSKGRRTARDLGWSHELEGPDGGRILMACTRAANSGKQGRIKRFRSKGSPMRVLEAFYETDRDQGGYGKPERWARITDWDAFEGPAPATFDVARDLDLHAPPRRHDGSPMVFEGLA